MATRSPDSSAARTPGTIRVGIGGWTYVPWRNGMFYPPKLPQAQELHYASRQLSAIEVNGTFYGTQKPATFAHWRDEAPDDFVFSLKAPRYATQRRVLAEAGESIARFIDSGISELGDKLGPVVWQFAPSKVFDADDFAAFLALLPAQADGRALRHVLEVRHPSFACAEYLQLARKHRCATVFTDSPKFPSIADSTAGFTYARLMRSEPERPAGYPPKALDQWAEHARTWAAGGAPAGLPYIDPPKEEKTAAASTAKSAARDVFIYFIDGAKERAPAAAAGLLKRLGFVPAEN